MIDEEKHDVKNVISLFPKTYFSIKENVSSTERSQIGNTRKYISLFIDNIKRIVIDPADYQTLESALGENTHSKYYSGANSSGKKGNGIQARYLVELRDVLKRDFDRKINENKVQESLLWQQFEFNKTKNKLTSNEVVKWYSVHFAKDPTHDTAYKMLTSEEYTDEFRYFILLFATLFGNKFDYIRETIEGLYKALNNGSVSITSYDGYNTKLIDDSKSDIVKQMLSFNDSYNSNADIQQIYNKLEEFYRYSLYCRTGEKINGYDTGSEIKNISDIGKIHQLVQYFTFFESIYIYLSVNGEPFDMIDDLFRYRFMLAVNNPLIQKEELFPLIQSYHNICCLYDRWVTAIGRKEHKFFYEPNEIYFSEYNLPDSYTAYKFVKCGFKKQDFERSNEQLYIEMKSKNNFCIRDTLNEVRSYLEFEESGDTICITSFENDSEYTDKTLRMLPILILSLQWIELIDMSHKSVVIKKELINQNSYEHFVYAGFRESSDSSECLTWDNLLYAPKKLDEI